jgi:hypothetical protein
VVRRRLFEDVGNERLLKGDCGGHTRGRLRPDRSSRDSRPGAGR